MTPRTLTAEPTDRRMWRLLLRLVYPDSHGTHDLFIWTRALYEHIAGDAIEPPPREPPRHHSTTTDRERVSFHSAYDKAADFAKAHRTGRCYG